jgi:hypothetical protein
VFRQCRRLTMRGNFMEVAYLQRRLDFEF